MKIVATFLFFSLVGMLSGADMDKSIYDPGKLKPVDSELKIKVGDRCPDFSLPSIKGKTVALSDFAGKKNVVLSFVPAAWTPVCSDQWPGYNLIEDVFKENDAVMLGISADNVPSLHAWVTSMGGVWFPVLSDFHPHGAVAKTLGILRSNGTSERALFVIDKKGVVRYIDVHDVNERPPLENLVDALKALNR